MCIRQCQVLIRVTYCIFVSVMFCYSLVCYGAFSQLYSIVCLNYAMLLLSIGIIGFSLISCRSLIYSYSIVVFYEVSGLHILTLLVHVYNAILCVYFLPHYLFPLVSYSLYMIYSCVFALIIVSGWYQIVLLFPHFTCIIVSTFQHISDVEDQCYLYMCCIVYYFVFTLLMFALKI